MKIGQFKEYKGYTGSIEYDPEDELHYGCLLNIEDHICYHSKSKDLSNLEERFHNAVDDYIQKKNKIQNNDDTPILVILCLGLIILSGSIFTAIGLDHISAAVLSLVLSVGVLFFFL